MVQSKGRGERVGDGGEERGIVGKKGGGIVEKKGGETWCKVRGGERVGDSGEERERVFWKPVIHT